MTNFKRVFSLATALFLICSLFGCNQTSPQPSESKSSTKGSTLIFAQSANPTKLDPALITDGYSTSVTSSIFEGLLGTEENSNKLVPKLAESWKESDDHLSYTFKLREDVKFHDGTKFNAEAAKINIERQLKGKPLYTSDMSYSDFFDSVKEVEVLNEYEIKVILKKPDSSILNKFSMCGIGISFVSPTAIKDQGNNVTQNPIGTGPYKYVESIKDQHTLLIVNKDYWGNKAQCEKVIIKVIPDMAARVAALNNNEIDITDIDPSFVDAIKQNGNKIMETPSHSVNLMILNTTKDNIFSGIEMRKALCSAINLKELNEGLYKGYSDPATSFLPKRINGHTEESKYPQFDSSAAEILAKKLNGKPINIATYTTQKPYNSVGGEALAVAIQGYLKKVGINSEINKRDWGSHKTAMTNANFDICFSGWSADYADASNFFSIIESQSLNYSKFKDPEITSLLESANATSFGKERDDIFEKVDARMGETAFYIPLSYAKILHAVREEVKNFRFPPIGGPGFYKASKELK